MHNFRKALSVLWKKYFRVAIRQILDVNLPKNESLLTQKQYENAVLQNYNTIDVREEAVTNYWRERV
jgi:hypothetical protein